jgi:Family of unknown function (DUF5309)
MKRILLALGEVLDAAIFSLMGRLGLVLFTVPANTYQTYQAIGNAEDVSDRIFNITPFDTPLLTLAGNGKADATFTEWQTETLLAVNANNAVIEGDDASNTAVQSTVRVGNYLQISERTFGITKIQEAVKKYGRASELARQRVNYMRALKRDAETIATQNQARVVGAAGTAQKMRSLPSWYATNTSRGATGANGTTTTAATDGTQRNFSETLLKTVMASCYSNGGQPTVVMSGPINRVNCSSQLSGGATKFYQVSDKELVATVTVYQSDFGPLKFVPNRFQRERDMHLIDPDYVEIRYLENPQIQDLAVTGLARRQQIWMTYTLAVLNEAAHGVIADLNTAIL